MTDQTFLDAHKQSRAFVANLMDRAAELISDQGERLLAEAGLSFPARAMSTVLFIGERGGASAADIAAALDQPHQLVTQRIALLTELGIVERIADPEDGRRKVITLTSRGGDEYARLEGVLKRADAAFAALFEEIECDLPAVLMRMAAALTRENLSDRVRAQTDAL